VQEPPVPLVYYPLGQSYRSTVALVARTAGDARPLIETVRGAMVAVDRRVPVFRTITLTSHLDEVVAGERLTAALLTVCGGMALLLATIGVYGVIAYAVIRRRREIGVRVALGARPRHVVRLVLGEGLGITAAGLAIGIGAAYLAARALAFMLYGVSASDPRTFLLVPSILTVVALLAAVGPARRALRLDPMTVLRQE
jgi:predicted lysophospholipase L1 biosynthesis ABC-type transport system permease subunit